MIPCWRFLWVDKHWAGVPPSEPIRRRGGLNLDQLFFQFKFQISPHFANVQTLTAFKHNSLLIKTYFLRSMVPRSQELNHSSPSLAPRFLSWISTSDKLKLHSHVIRLMFKSSKKSWKWPGKGFISLRPGLESYLNLTILLSGCVEHKQLII